MFAEYCPQGEQTIRSAMDLRRKMKAEARGVARGSFAALKERAGATKRGREEKSDDTSSRKNRKVDIGDGN